MYYLIGRTLDGGCFPLCLWISKPDVTDNSLWPTVCGGKTHRPVFEVNVRVSWSIPHVADNGNFFIYGGNVCLVDIDA